MNIAGEKRLKYIEMRLYWEGWIRRTNIEEFFQISTPQATKDLKEYKTMAPENINYDPNAKKYITGKKFKPIFKEPTSEDYLTRLLHLKRKTPQNEFFCGKLVNYLQLPKLTRFVDKEILKNLVRAINSEMIVKINYQSMSKELPTARWISPHSLAHDGNRWHVRSFCYEKQFYCDFNLSRVLDIFEVKEGNIGNSLDYQWNTDISLKVEPNPNLVGGPRACILLDYDMKDGVREFKIPAAFYFYIRLTYGFDLNTDDDEGRRQQIILKNKDEVEQKVRFLHDMSISAIKKAIDDSSIILID